MSQSVIDSRELNEVRSLLSRSDVLVISTSRGKSICESISPSVTANQALIPTGEPELESVKVVAELIATSPPTAILAVGGGSVIDFAKAVAALLGHVELEANLQAASSDVIMLRPIKLPPILCIPTTLGSGADVSSSTVLKFGEKKIAISSPYLKPSKSYFFPNFISDDGMSHIPGALDVIGHAFEGLSSRLLTPELKAYAIQALKVVLGLDFEGGWTGSNKNELFLAARLASQVQDSALVGIPHALAHLFPTMSHGLSVGHFLHQVYTQLGFGDGIYASVDEQLQAAGLSVGEVLAKVKSLLALSEEYRSFRFEDFLISESDLGALSRSVFIRASAVPINSETLQNLILTRGAKN